MLRNPIQSTIASMLLLSTLLACTVATTGTQTDTVPLPTVSLESTPSATQTLSPTDASVPAKEPPTGPTGASRGTAANADPTPSDETPTPSAPSPLVAPTTAKPSANASPGQCRELCKEEFWERGATIAFMQAELDAGTDPAAKGDDGTRALVYALAFESNPEFVELLLESGTDLNAVQDESGRPLLHTAVEVAAHASHPDAGTWFSENVDDLVGKVPEAIESLLQGGADAAARDKYGQSALYWYLGTILELETYVVDARIVRLLLEYGTEFAEENDTDATILTFALWAKSGPEVIRLLLEYGAHDVVRLNGSDTLLHMAAWFTASPPVFSLLLERGEEVNAVGEFGWTPLLISVRNGEIDPQVIRLLLDKGAEVSTRSDEGATPLHHAATHSGPEVIRLLLERGADIAARDHLMNTPLHSAMTDGYSVPTDFSPDPEVVRVLLENGAEVDARNAAGSTPLHGGAGHQQLGAAQLLLAYGADAAALNYLGSTPLHRGVRATTSRTVTLLLKHGADVNAADEILRTPLHLAAESLCRSPSPRTVKLLLESGAVTNAKDREGNTPLHTAAKKSRTWNDPSALEVIRLLLNAGANITAVNNDGLTACDLSLPDDEGTRETICP